MSQPDQTAPADPLRAPHQPISGYYQTEDERAGFLREIFDSTATDYDKVERTLALGTGPWYRRRALERAGLAPGMRVVDVGFGTGLVAAQGALAWLWAKSGVNIPIPGFKTTAQAEENARAMAFGPLNSEQLRQIDEALGA